MENTKLITVIAIILNLGILQAQDFSGHYVRVDRFKGEKITTRLFIAQDSSFKYTIEATIVIDSAIGYASFENGIISLSYITPNYTKIAFADTVETGIQTVPYLSTEVKSFSNKLLDPRARHRPIALRLQRSRATIIETVGNKDLDNRRRKYRLRKKHIHQ